MGYYFRCSFSNDFLLFVVAIYNPVHEVENIQDLCQLLTTSDNMSYVRINSFTGITHNQKRF